MELRTATDADVDAIVALVGRAYRGTGGDPGWTTEAHLFEGPRTNAHDVSTILTSPRDTLLVADDGGAIVACCTVTDLGGRAYFGMFAVSPDAQGSGLGKTVLAEAEHMARDRLGAVEMTMTVITTRDELLSWYERRGYRRTGQITPLAEEYTVHVRPGVTIELETLTKPLPATPSADHDPESSSALG
ncbi:GNAT family N-acetyltransferase [Labedella phragmitis]|uniref:GNAT family N-acetyltransferase n=1 Tax=Labedella phragmitis TaxID=2498849 RepID=A0A3S5CFD6_9MICO|nr:GNAT family N-acetyltransferase [Labedella phragmitis]RWZ52773.1 GNAT family N-acetyltransferase [Labedella phragmitis]